LGQVQWCLPWHPYRLPNINRYCLAAYPFYPPAYHEQLELHLAAGLCQLVPANNQTIILTVSIGLSTAFIATLFPDTAVAYCAGIAIIQRQPKQYDTCLISKPPGKTACRITRKEGLPVLSQVPIITMRLEKVNGKTAADAKKDSTLRIFRPVPFLGIPRYLPRFANQFGTDHVG
jgi:hypothetical protein